MNMLRRISLVVCMQITLLAIAGTSIAETFCPPNVSSDIIDDLTVNNFCIVSADSLTGDIIVETGGFLIITGTTVKGDIEVQSGGRISAQSIIVQGDIIGNATSLFIINNSFIAQNEEQPDIGGDVQSSNGVFASITGTVVSGDMELSNNGFAVVSSNIIAGDLECSGFVSESENIVGGDKLGTCAD